MENGVVIKGVEYEIVPDENEYGILGCEDCDLFNNKFCTSCQDCPIDSMFSIEEELGTSSVFKRVQSDVERFARENLGKEVTYRYRDNERKGMVVGYNASTIEHSIIVSSLTEGWFASLIDENDKILLHSPLNRYLDYVDIEEVEL